MTKIVIFPIKPGIDEPRSAALDQLVNDFPQCNLVYPQTMQELFAELPDAEILAAYFVTNDILDKAPNLKYVCGFLAGVDKLPLKRLEEENILLTTGRGIHALHMTEYAIMVMIMMARNMDRLLVAQKNHLWGSTEDFVQDQIYGKKLGILGVGSIGKELAKKASMMGMEVIGVRKTPEKTDFVSEMYGMEEGLEVVCSTCDYVVNLLPHTPATHKIIAKKYFDMLKPDACMINIGRGDTVNEEDLYHALINKQFKRYITDVFEKEPLDSASKFWDLDNIIITPHVCGPNLTYLDKAYPIVKQNIAAYLNKDYENMLNVLSYERGY